MRRHLSDRRMFLLHRRPRALLFAVCCAAATMMWSTGPSPAIASDFATSIVALPQNPTLGPTPTLPPKEELERLKLREETTKLAQENDRFESDLGWLLALAPFLTVIIGVITLGAALWKQSSDLATAQKAARTAAEQWREEIQKQQQAEVKKSQQWRDEFQRQQTQDQESKERDALRRFDETLTQISANISSDKLPLQLHAAASLGLFVKERYRGMLSLDPPID